MLWRYRYNQYRKQILILENQLQSAFEQSWSKINMNQKENQIIHDYLKNGVAILNNSIPALLSSRNFSIKFASVFIHQRPYVTRLDTNCTGNKRCELGDLLLIFSYLDAFGNIRLNRAMIAQAKSDKEIDNECQRCLYDEVIKFEYDGGYKNKYNLKDLERHLPTYYRQRDQAIKYLILQSKNKISYISPPWSSLLEYEYSQAMFRFMTGDSGKRFSRKPPYHRGWSRIIWDLIEFIGKEATGKTYGGHIRGNYLSYFISRMNIIDKEDNEYIEIETDKKAGGATPVLFTFVKDLGLPEKNNFR